jgi:hypothetical protein
MVMKSSLAEIVDGRLVLPDDALALLPAGTQLRVIIDTERRTVCVHAKDPMAPLSPDSEAFLDALGELSADSTDEEYFAPVTEETLREIKRKRKERGSAE